MITRKTKDYWIKILEQNKQLCGTGLNAPINELKIMIAEVESLEVEPTCLFKEGRTVLVGDFSENSCRNRRIFSHKTSDGKFIDSDNVVWKCCRNLTEWLPYTGNKPELVDGQKGWYIKIETGVINTYSGSREPEWDNSKRGNKIVEFQYWMDV